MTRAYGSNKDTQFMQRTSKQLTGLSLEGEDVSKGFQGPSKHGKKKGKVNLYEKFHTQRGRRTTKIEPILPEMVQTACYVIK
jgi:hypothetical protein